MAANEQLEGFLASEVASAAEPAPPEAPEPPPEAAAPKPEAKAEPAPKAAAAKSEPDDDAPPPKALEGEDVIPLRAYEDERRKRNDWKNTAARLEGELAAMRRQQEDAQRRAAAPPPQPQQPPPDPATNPQGWAQHVVQQQQAALLNERLNNSEMMLADKIGAEKLSEYVQEFRGMAEADPTLFGKLYSQPHPYAWMTREVDRLRLVRDVGDDPAAFRAKIEAEARAKWDAEAATKPPPVSPAAGLQPSLATARSVAGRSAGAWTGEPSLEDVLSPIQNRKRPNGAGGSVRY
jgi:hypothetical protein